MDQADDLLGDDAQPFKIDKFDWISEEFTSPNIIDDTQAVFEPMPFSATVTGPEDSRDEATVVKNNKKESQRKKRYYEEASEAERSTPLRRRKKPNGMPKRPLSAYNIFFQKERVRLMESGEEASSSGKIGFEELGRIIGQRWRTLDEASLDTYRKLAEEDGERYRREMEAYNNAKNRADILPTVKSNMFKEDTSFGSNEKSCNEYSATMPQHTSQVGMSQPSMQPMPHMPPYQRYPTSHSGGPSQPHPANYAPPPCRDPNCHCCVAKRQQPHQMLRYTHQQGQGHSFHPPPSSATRAQEPPFFPQMRAQSRPGMPEQSNKTNNSSYFSADNSSQARHQPAYPPNTFPLPPGHEITLPDAAGNLRKYRVEYAAVRMSVEEAEKYMEQISNNGISIQHASQNNTTPQNCE
mmetsp:Transcript_15100/g.21382  ORF Transcript_15100/g.21382 Transcript_15100/m.21382 type:complete len:409 (-) Transcript_15100:63-1289(-)